MTKPLSFIIIIGVILIGGTGFFVWQNNIISKEVLKLEVIAPDETVVGEEVTYVVKYKNNGEVRLENPVLVFEYPAGSLPSEGDGKTRITQSLEDIYPGQEKNFSFTARLFGKEGEVKEAKILLQYTPKNLTARFESETTATTVISSVPLNFELDIPSRMESGQEINFELNYFSNSEYPLSDLRIKINYPEGFEFIEASPAPIGENEWKIGVLNRGDGGRIRVKGSLQGDVQEVKVFEATLGSWREGEFVLLKKVARGIELSQTTLLVTQEVNGNEDYVASPGDTLHYVISFRNTSDKNMENLFMIVSLEGRPFDLNSMKMGKGKFQQGDNSIIWEAKDVTRLRFIGKGEEGSVEFWVNVKEEWETFSPQDNNFILRNKVILSDVKEEFEIKVNSKFAVEQKAYFKNDVFENTGPAPPVAGEQTTYTIVWQAENFSNNAMDVKVKATLAQGVSFTDNVFPEDAIVNYNPALREVVWEVEDLAAGAGIFDTAPSVAFQVVFTPTESQKGSIAQIIGKVSIAGQDVWTERFLSASDAPIDTSLPDDSTVSTGVVQ